jgi:hypothetical protein
MRERERQTKSETERQRERERDRERVMDETVREREMDIPGTFLATKAPLALLQSLSLACSCTSRSSISVTLRFNATTVSSHMAFSISKKSLLDLFDGKTETKRERE